MESGESVHMDACVDVRERDDATRTKNTLSAGARAVINVNSRSQRFIVFS